jgi:2-keto-4-pentenoate hydratase
MIPHAFPIAVQHAESQVHMHEGRHRDPDPCLPLCWLANFLAQRGPGLRAGQAVITGSYAGVLELPLAEEVRIRFGDLGELHVTFAEIRKRGAE